MAAGGRPRGEGAARGRLPRKNVPCPLGYAAVPIQFSEKQKCPHWLYMKEHKVREGTQCPYPKSRTLFILNVPPYCTEEDLTQLLSCCGTIQSVELQEKPDLAERQQKPQSGFFQPKLAVKFHVAYVVFRRPASIRTATSLGRTGPLVISSESRPVKTGLQKWIANYSASLVDPEALKVEVDTFMEKYDKKMAKEDAEAEKEEGVPDNEGWVKVTRKGRRPGIPRTEAVNLRLLEKEKQKRARKELLNFYAWQHRETKREHLAQLRKKFEEDKQRIALMRAQRKFRPY
ncbi:ribosomal RNA-processing protein 7 homolog A [Ornithorhynchus anatinus]|uniref:Ribosomal RNA-processing protein 7 homolog A n=1 Tax=Ornithorhynchus anatinus TaxID=9258 RepID=F6WY89_ORNAN|nr:ribosomal RNA-processing protein 7 homolog A [Ornithorhynchus anatinus]